VSGAATYAGNSRETDVRGAAAAETAAAEAGADGSTDSDASSSSSAAAAAAAASVCRAFYKLQEAVQIAGVDERFVFKGAMAIDAGAAPGGWTKYLALDRGCEKVKTQPKPTPAYQLSSSFLFRLMLMSAVPFGWVT
jgi:hypothetical protein